MTQPIQRPKSVTNNYINVAAGIVYLVGLWLCQRAQYDTQKATPLLVVSYLCIIFILEVIFLRTPWRESTGLDFTKYNFSLDRVIVKLVGVYGSFGFIAFLYWISNEYHGAYYAYYWRALDWWLPAVLWLVPPYVIFVDGRMKDPHDSYYAWGRFLTLRWEGLNGTVLRQHALSWVVKAFYLPIMLIGMAEHVNADYTLNLHDALASFPGAYHAIMMIGYSIDIVPAVAGYALSLRLFDNHIRSTEPTAYGWASCLICYEPFLTVLALYATLSQGDYNWQRWLDGYPVLQVIWGTVGLFFLITYATASLNFGTRFSNLTHRGIITNGMYRFTKHPAYLSKNLVWWTQCFAFMPQNNFLGCVRILVMLGVINFIYFMRARSEERHLSRDPVYVQYALWMNEHGVLSKFAKRVPFFRYKPPVGWENTPSPYPGIK